MDAITHERLDSILYLGFRMVDIPELELLLALLERAQAGVGVLHRIANEQWLINMRDGCPVPALQKIISPVTSSVTEAKAGGKRHEQGNNHRSITGARVRRYGTRVRHGHGARDARPAGFGRYGCQR